MSYAILDIEVMKSRLINQTAKLVYSAIVSHYRGQESEMFPSYNRIAELVGISRITAIRAVKSLVCAGYIDKEPQYNRFNNGFNSNKYNLVSKTILPSIKSDTTPSIKNDTTPSIKSDTTNNIKGKITKEINKKATGSAQCEPEQPEQTDKRQTLTARLQLLGNNTEWLEVVELYGRAYLRYSSPISNKYTNNSTINTATEFLSKLGIVSEPKILEHNQHRAEGVIM